MLFVRRTYFIICTCILRIHYARGAFYCTRRCNKPLVLVAATVTVRTGCLVSRTTFFLLIKMYFPYSFESRDGCTRRRRAAYKVLIDYWKKLGLHQHNVLVSVIIICQLILIPIYIYYIIMQYCGGVYLYIIFWMKKGSEVKIPNRYIYIYKIGVLHSVYNALKRLFAYSKIILGETRNP